MRGDRVAPEGLEEADRRGARAPGGAGRPASRRSGRSAAAVRPQRRARLDAGDDGHGPQPRAQRRVRRRARRDHRQPALRLGLVPAARADVRQRRLRRAGRALRGGDRARQAGPRRDARHRARRGRAGGAHAALPGALRLPVRPARAAAARDRGRLRLLERRPRHRLPPHQRHPRRLGHRRQRPADGVRQPRPGVVLRRGVLARRGHRRARAQRRLPARRAGRGRRLGRPHAARPRRAAQLEAGDPRPPAARSCARSSATTATCRTPSSRSRRGGSTCSRPATPSAPRRRRSASPPTPSRRGC